jgi:hypothetical protein
MGRGLDDEDREVAAGTVQFSGKIRWWMLREAHAAVTAEVGPTGRRLDGLEDVAELYGVEEARG